MSLIYNTGLKTQNFTQNHDKMYVHVLTSEFTKELKT